MKLKYFELSEFDSPDKPGSGNEMNRVFLFGLDKARELYGKPMRVISGKRTAAHNRAKKGKPNSSHLIGCAADIECDTNDLQDMMTAFWAVGFRRFGINRIWGLHVDCDPTKNSPAIWGYGNEETERYRRAVQIFRSLRESGE